VYMFVYLRVLPNRQAILVQTDDDRIVSRSFRQKTQKSGGRRCPRQTFANRHYSADQTQT